ncbi:MAG: Mu-like prophage major head subunit gpT family protein [Lentisphaeria bacterium]|jgi:hypothetical protein
MLNQFAKPLPPIQANAPATPIQAIAEIEQLSTDGLTAISGVAYSGGAIVQPWSRSPIYIDLSGLSIRAQVPLLYNHYNSPLSRLGVVTPSISGNQLRISGGIDPEAESAKQIIAMGKRIPWQLSVGAIPESIEEVRPGATAQVNGREVHGPALIARQANLYEVSLVAAGACADTQLKISAALNIPLPPSAPNQKEPSNMLTEKLRKYIQAKYSLGDLGDAEIIAHLKTINSSVAAEEAAMNAPPPQSTAGIQAAAPAAASAPPAPPAPPAPAPPAPQPDSSNAIQAAIAAERQRVNEIDAICVRHPEIGIQARQGGWTADATRRAVLDAINASYTPAMPNIQQRDNSITQPILAAAAWQAAGFDAQAIEAAYGREALDNANHRWRGNISLQELIIEAAAANGGMGLPRRLTAGNWHSVCQQAITASASGVSPVNLSGLLGGVIERALLEGFGQVDNSWREIAARRRVDDFREIVFYRLAAGGGFSEVGPTGELKHGEYSEVEYRNQATTFGQLLGVTRKDIINDDLGALTATPTELGLNGAIKLNEVFWTEFMNNSAFFCEANQNLLANDPLSVDGLTAARKAFMKLRDQSGRLLGFPPSILLVPPSLTTLATQLFNDKQIIVIGTGNTPKVIPNGNPHTGKYTPVESPYLEDESIPGYSSTAYYLLAKPSFRATIQVVFLNGIETPTIESSALVFDLLGLSWRAYYDFGVRKMDPAAGLKVAGATPSP